MNICYQVSMSDAISDNGKRGPGRPRVGATLVGVRVEPGLLSAVDRYVDDTGAASRPDAIRSMVEEHLRAKGYYGSRVG